MTGTKLVPRRTDRSSSPETVLIIGGGATGLVTLRNIVEEVVTDSSGSYPLFAPLLVERRDDVGGVWYWSDSTYSLERSIGADKCQRQSPLFDHSGKPHWPSPAYLNLRGNVLPEFLEFSGKKMQKPKNDEVFPTLEETHEYLKSFAEPYRQYIKTGVEVLKVQELSQDRGWQVTLKHWSHPSIPAADTISFTPYVETLTFDRVIVAAGWYDTPYYPDVPGLSHIASTTSHIHHCKHYRDSTPYINKRVIVVGNNNSANEVAAHLAPFNSPEHPVYRSSKSAPIEKCPALPDERIKDVGMITEYKLVGGKVEVKLNDGSVIGGVDYVILGTGYGQKYPWLHVLTDESRRTGGEEVEQLTPDHLKATRVPFLYNHALFCKTPRLTLAFVGLVVSYMPFSFNDLLSAWIVGVWSGKITTVPTSIDERLQFEKDRLEYLYTQRCKTTPPAITLDPNNPTTYSGYHLIGGSLADGPPSELHFAAQLFDELAAADPKRIAKFEYKWDKEREEKQIGMYRRKKVWLEENGERIRNDPFDLLGVNRQRYGWLVRELVSEEWRSRGEGEEEGRRANL
ncbi:putative Thiol-specific monooxygenase (putative) [Pseudozyma hubeiensis]|nr:putative Thiol-specific monooxygenase (putative) [Pseudozyma hubeiensis]